MLTFLRAIKFEWKIQCSQRSNWLLALAFMSIFWLGFRLQELTIRSSIGFSVSTAQGLGLFGSLFVAVISVHNLLRETHRGFDHFWSRSQPAISYTWIKFFGSILTVFTFLTPTLLCFLALLLFNFGFGALLPGLKVWLILIGPTFLFILSFSLLVSLLIRTNVIATVVLALVVAGDLVQNFDVTSLLAFAPYDIYTSAAIGFGPDNSFVLLNRALYLSLTLLICILSSIVSRYRLPVIANKKNPASTVFKIFMVVSLVASSWWIAVRYLHLSEIANIPANPTEHILQRKECALFESYKIELVLNETGRISSGIALLKLYPANSQITVPVTLNHGLEMTETQFVSNNMLIVKPESTLADNGHEIKIQYQGKMIIPRFAYTTFYQEQDVAALGFEAGFYADSNYAFILDKGTWHPFSECSPDSITITIPNSYSFIYSSADTTKKNMGTSLSIWSSPTPGVLLLAGNYPQTIKDEAWNILLPNRFLPETTQLLLLDIYQSAIVHLAKHVSEPENAHKQIIVIPLLRHTYQQDALTTIFIPERLSLLRELIVTGNDFIVLRNNNDLVSSVALDVITSWWCEEGCCPELSNYMLAKHTQNGERQEDYLVYSLLYYTSLQLSNEMDNQIIVGEIVSLYETALDDPLRRVKLPLRLPPESIRILSQLNTLWDQTSPQDFWQLMEECRKQSESEPIQMDEFAKLVNIITGHEFQNLLEINP